VIDDVENITPQAFQAEGDDIVLLGSNTDEIGGSEYLYVTADLVAGAPPTVDLVVERSLQQAVLKMTREKLLSSAHDCSEGGLVCALAEAALGNGDAPHGVTVELDDDLRPVACLFGEAQGRVVVSCSPDRTAEVLRIAEGHGVPARRVGAVRGAADPFDVSVRGGSVSASLADMADAYFDSIGNLMQSTPTGA
jgi:phosphoribosylformylglycinamidine synthase